MGGTKPQLYNKRFPEAEQNAMGLKRVGHDLATEQQQTLYKLELLDQRVYIYVALVCECMLSRFTCV